MGANVLDFPSVSKGQIFEQLRGRPSDLQPSTTGTILFARSGFQLSIKNIDGVDLNLTSLTGLQYYCESETQSLRRGVMFSRFIMTQTVN